MTHRYTIELCPKRKPPVFVESSDLRSTTIERARLLGTDARVIDSETGLIYSLRLERWIRPKAVHPAKTASTVDGGFSEDTN